MSKSYALFEVQLAQPVPQSTSEPTQKRMLIAKTGGEERTR
jgi:hypothetical protein